MKKQDLRDLISRFGGRAVFCEMLNEAIDQLYFSESAGAIKATYIYSDRVSKWLHRQKKPIPPAEYVRPIVHAARAAGIAIDEHKLRPDLYPYPLVANDALTRDSGS